jgi:hypothetical protein
MTCQECLAVLATGSLRDLGLDSPVMTHAAACPDCSRVTMQLRDREFEAASLLNALPPLSNPIMIAESAVGVARRRRKGRIVVMMTGTALAATTWLVAATTVIPALNRADAHLASDLRTETIQLSCLSPQQAADIINPYVRTRGSTYYLPSSGIAAITVRGTTRELLKSRALISQFEKDPSAACRLGPQGLSGVIAPVGTAPSPPNPNP